MATTTSTSTTKTGSGKGLQKKVGPLPVWGWAAVVIVGVVVYVVIKHKQSSTATSSNAPTTAELQQEIDTLQSDLQNGYGYGGGYGSYTPSQTQGSTPNVTIYNETVPGHQTTGGKGFAGSGYIHLNPGQAKAYLKAGIPIFYMNPSGQLVRWNGKSALPRGTALYGQKQGKRAA